ncbi:anti-sigma factor [Blastomonas sp.]|uniref:anti-sigma factor family protein n=1 Tax=Blastomonas sp. TaxID=1909299 RepID=UPI003593E4C8
MTFDYDIIMAYVDGELDLVTAKRVERAALKDNALAAMIAEQRALKAKLAAHFYPVLDEALPARLMRPLEKIDTRLASPARSFRWSTVTAMAASLAIGLLVGPQFFSPSSGPLTVRSDTLVADGTLANALDTQLASAQPENAKIRIGLTFQDKAGAVCRSFDSAAIAGVACRQENDWIIQRAMAGSPRPAYRQAAADSLMDDIEAMMAGDIVDAATERVWRDNNWAARGAVHN